MDHKQSFAEQQEIAIYWFNKSSDLRGAAGALWVSCDDDISEQVVVRCGLWGGFRLSAAVPSVYLMLAGMSLELLYKSIIVATGHDVPHTHDLERLASLAGVAVGEVDRGLLKILTGASVWHGRYPVPKTMEAFKELSDLKQQYLFTTKPLGGRFVVSTPNRALAWEGFDRLWGEAAPRFWRKYRPR